LTVDSGWFGIAEGDVGTGDDLRAEVVAAGVGGIESEFDTIEVVDEGTGVAAEAGGVADDALGIETDDEGFILWFRHLP
jgi:hypothetical protein